MKRFCSLSLLFLFTCMSFSPLTETDGTVMSADVYSPINWALSANGTTVTTFSGATVDTGIDASVLNDGVTYNLTGYFDEAKKSDYNQADIANYPEKYRFFTTLPSGVILEFQEMTYINHLVVHEWKSGSIGEYRVEVSDDGETWSMVTGGGFESPEPIRVNKFTSSRFIGFNTLYTKFIRLTVLGLNRNMSGYYLTEVEAYNNEPSSLMTQETTFASYNLSSSTSAPVADINPLRGDWKPQSGRSQYWYAVRFYNPRDISRIKLIQANNAVREYEIYSANSEAAFNSPFIGGAPKPEWNLLCRGNLNGDGGGASIDIIQFDRATALCYMLNIVTWAETPYFSMDLYDWFADDGTDPAVIFSKGVSQVLGKVTEEAAITTNINPLPASMEIGGRIYGIDWYCDSEYINIQTGEVSRQNEDKRINIKAVVTCAELAGNASRTVERGFVLLATDNEALTVFKNENFDSGPAEEIFYQISGNVAVSGGVAEIGSGSAAAFDLRLPYGFYVDEALTAEMFISENTSGGTISLCSGTLKPLTVKIENRTLYIEYEEEGKYFEKEYTGSIRLKFDIYSDTFNMYTDAGNGYKLMIYKAALLRSVKSVDNIVFAAEDGECLSIGYIKAYMPKEKFFDSVADQFDFLKISDEQPLNVKKDLSLIDRVGEINFRYESSDRTVLDPSTGKLSTFGNGSGVILTVTGTEGENRFTKSFYLIVGKSNLLSGKTVTANVSAKTGHSAGYITDGDIESAFITNAKSSYRITVDIGEPVYLNEIVAFETESTASVTAHSLHISLDGSNYTEIYKGYGIESGAGIPVGIRCARYLQLCVDKADGAGSGIAELLAYFNLNNISGNEKLIADLDALDGEIEIKDGASIPKVGTFGTEFSLSSTNSAVSFKDDGGGWLIEITKPATDISVTVTLTAKNEEYSEKRRYDIIVYGRGSLRGNAPSYASSAPRSNGSASVVSIVSDADYEKPADPSDARTDLTDELISHWGEREIRHMLEAGAVLGDGSGLNLGRAVSRVEFAAMIIRALSYEILPYAGGFEDVKADDWYAGYAQTAAYNGIMVGDGRCFRSGDPLSRQEMARVLINICRKRSYPIDFSAKNGFTDSEAISGWARDSVDAAVGLNLVNGYDTGVFLPDGSLRRDEAIVVVYRLVMLLSEVE